jgi:flagellar biosynthetic protein FliO
MRPMLPAIERMKRKRPLIVMAVASVGILLGLVWFGSPVADEGEPVPETADEGPASSISTGGMAFRVIGSVILVIGVLYGAMFAMKILSRRAAGGNLKKDAISVLQRRYIAPKKAIYVVKVGAKTMVVGVTDAHISHLADLTEDEVEGLRPDETEKAGQFKQHLMAFGLGMRNKG